MFGLQGSPYVAIGPASVYFILFTNSESIVGIYLLYLLPRFDPSIAYEDSPRTRSPISLSCCEQ
jgi:hypothetical protein